MTLIDSPPEDSLASRLGWALFLACSWTWCIGMYLPVILVRDYGTGGWVVFAAPNVVGAAAMGWALRSRESSQRLVRRHVHACVAFSVVTVSFQLFFLNAYVARWSLPAALAGVAALLVLCAVRIGRKQTLARPWMGWAVLAYLASLAAFALLLSRTGWQSTPQRPATRELIALALSCAFGFALCPYLDLTFHAARQAMTKSAARFAFGIGFGLLFLVMILFTLCYAAPFASGWPASPAVRHLVAAHMTLQIVFTVAVHVDAIDRANEHLWGPTDVASGLRRGGNHPLHRLGITLGVIVAIVLSTVSAGAPASGAHAELHYRGIALREVVYGLYMAFYGLVFPAYVWLCVIPRGEDEAVESEGPSRRAFIAFTAAVALAAPMFWLGFIERWTLTWLFPAVAIVLMARLFVPRPTQTNVRATDFETIPPPRRQVE